MQFWSFNDKGNYLLRRTNQSKNLLNTKLDKTSLIKRRQDLVNDHAKISCILHECPSLKLFCCTIK